MPDLAGIEMIVKDSSDRCSGKQPGLGYQLTLGVGQLLCVARQEALFVEIGGQLAERGRPCGVAPEQLGDGYTFFGVDVNTARMLGAAVQELLTVPISPTGLVPEGQ